MELNELDIAIQVYDADTGCGQVRMRLPRQIGSNQPGRMFKRTAADLDQTFLLLLLTIEPYIDILSLVFQLVMGPREAAHPNNFPTPMHELQVVSRGEPLTQFSLCVAQICTATMAQQ